MNEVNFGKAIIDPTLVTLARPTVHAVVDRDIGAKDGDPAQILSGGKD